VSFVVRMSAESSLSLKYLLKKQWLNFSAFLLTLDVRLHFLVFTLF
jgi:hypothetical protein